MKKTLIIAAVTAFISTGAMAKPSTNHHAPAPHSSHSVETVSHSHKAAPKSHHASHHSSKVYVVNSRPAPKPPRHHHHHHNSLDLGDALIAFAILATAF